MQPVIKLKTLIISSIAIIFAIISISVYFIIDNLQKTATIEFIVAPLSANIDLNGRSYTSYVEHKIKPGNYELVIQKEGFFEPYYETFYIQDGEQKTIYVELAVIEGTNWYQDHPEDAAGVDAVLDGKLTAYTEYIIENYPLITVLPITVEYYEPDTTYVYYIISYSFIEGEPPTVLIKDYTGNNYEKALDRIRLEGYDPAQYTIQYFDESEDIRSYRAPSD